MNRMVILVSLFVLSTSFSNAGEECPNQLDSTSKYSDLNGILSCFSKKIEHLENMVIQLQGSNAAVPVPKNGFLSSGDIIELQGFSFNLLRCFRKSTSVTCEFLITNNQTDTVNTIFIGSNTRAIGFSGKEHKGTTASIGGEKRSTVARKMFVADVPMSAQLHFLSIPPDLEGFRLLEMRTDSGSVQYKNIKINQ